MIIRNSTSKCEACSFPTNSPHEYVTRHGDIELLCPACYSAALNPMESPAKAFRDKVIFAVLAGVAVLVMLTGCGGFPPRVETVYVAGVPVVEHIDTEDAPKSCGDRTEWSGCHVKVGGVSHVWRSSMVAPHTVIHERAHVAGMKHTAWTRDFTGRPCATVTTGGGHYKAGQRICVEQRQEIIIAEAS